MGWKTITPDMQERVIDPITGKTTLFLGTKDGVNLTVERDWL